jgi:hypothetical protein
MAGMTDGLAAEGVSKVKIKCEKPLRMMYRRPMTAPNKINGLWVRHNLLRNSRSGWPQTAALVLSLQRRGNVEAVSTQLLDKRRSHILGNLRVSLAGGALDEIGQLRRGIGHQLCNTIRHDVNFLSGSMLAK